MMKIIPLTHDGNLVFGAFDGSTKHEVFENQKTPYVDEIWTAKRKSEFFSTGASWRVTDIIWGQVRMIGLDSENEDKEIVVSKKIFGGVFIRTHQYLASITDTTGDNVEAICELNDSSFIWQLIHESLEDDSFVRLVS